MLLGFGKLKPQAIALRRTERGGTTHRVMMGKTMMVLFALFTWTMTKKTSLREVTAMCSTVMKRAIFKADCERYRRYAEAKQRLSKDLSPAEYEAAVKKLARKYRI